VAKERKKFTSIQPDLFQELAEATALEARDAQDLDINLELMAATKHAIREARQLGYSRERIVERMNLCLPEAAKKDQITLRQLNAWTAHSKEYHNMPARYLPAFCWATQSLLPLLALVQPLGYDLVDGREQLVAQLGSKLLDQARARRDIKRLEQILHPRIRGDF
jgi:hypothetical protein